jgi:hypothetical protein
MLLLLPSGRLQGHDLAGEIAVLFATTVPRRNEMEIENVSVYRTNTFLENVKKTDREFSRLTEMRSIFSKNQK